MSASLLARACSILVVAAVTAAAGAVRAAEQRVALLVGNNAYAATPLQNAVNDARDLATALRNLGFRTIVRENATRRDLIEALREFGQAIDQAEAAVFFYAGHALQFKDRNYLVPVDTEMRSEEDIALFSVEIQQVFDRMDRARTRTNVIILDACRDNPFASSFKVASPGLAQASAPSGTLVAYATAPGSVAADGFGRNGIYTKHILQHIATPDLPVESLFKRVREGVERETQKRQTPWDSSSLKGEFHFSGAGRSPAPAPVAVAAPAGPSVDVQLQIEREFWISARDSNRPEELQAYLDNYPEGKFVALARLRLRSMGQSVTPEGLQIGPAQMPGVTRMQPRSITPEEPPPANPPGKAPDKSSWLRWRELPPARLVRVAAGASAPTAGPSIDDLYRLPQIADMQLSPDGKTLAALMPVGGHQNIVLFDIAARKARVGSALDKDVTWVRWISDRRLLFKTGYLAERGCDCITGKLWAADIDGTDLRQLDTGIIGARGASVNLQYKPIEVVRLLPGGGDDFIAQESVMDVEGRVNGGAIFRMTSRTGRRTALAVGKPDAGENEHWVVDNAGVARVFSAVRRGATAIYYRDGEAAPWRKLDEIKVGEPGWEPLAIAADGKSIYANSWKGRDKSAIVLLDPQPGATGRVIASHPYVDVKRLIMDDGVPVGISYNADRPGFAWFDEELERIQTAVDGALPRATNELTWTRNRERLLIKSSSDVSPGTFYFFDRASGRIEWFADRYPWLKRESLVTVRPVRYRARDGFEIPAYLTLPKDMAPNAAAPLVVLVHGGPWVDGYSWRFDPEVQHLATRGYAVLQPNFRGTTRYGWKHFSASFKQWGRTMQDDLVDGVRWAVAQGYADPNRVCIFGASYGGYAAMMGVAATPDVFRCAIDYLGPTDVNAILDSPWMPQSYSDFVRYGAREMIGDPDKDRQALAAVSPVDLAARIKAPVLMAYGTDDATVPIDHGNRMKAALDRAGARYEWFVGEGEGHGFRQPEVRRRFYQAVEKFLAENLK